MAYLLPMAQLYEQLYNAMMEKYFADIFDGCERMASSLLLKADLPLIIRARCHMVLGTAGAYPDKTDTNFLGHANAAVSLLEARAQDVVLEDEIITPLNQKVGLYDQEPPSQELVATSSHGIAEGPYHAPQGIASNLNLLSTVDTQGDPTTKRGEAERVGAKRPVSLASGSDTRPRLPLRTIEPVVPEDARAEEAPRRKVRRTEQALKKKVRRLHTGGSELDYISCSPFAAL